MSKQQNSKFDPKADEKTEFSRGFAEDKGKKPKHGKSGKGKKQQEQEKERKIGNSWNDINWWAQYPELLRAVAAVPYPNKPGMDLRGPTVTATRGEDTFVEEMEYVMPGIARIEYIYSIGYSNSPQDPASICAAKLYERVRATYSGTLRADATDMFMYLIAVDQIHAYIAWLKRIYRTLNLYTPENRLFPHALFNAQLAIEDGTSEVFVRFLQQKPQFEYYINQLVRMANNWYVPGEKEMNIFERHRWMNENVYSDALSLAGQMYIMCPLSFYKIGNDDVTTATRMDPVSPYMYTPIDLFNLGVEMIEALASVGNSYDMKGYFEKAYAGVPSFTSALLLQEEQQVPVYIPEVLDQIHNLTLVEDYTASPITQDPLSHTIIHTPTVETSLTTVTFRDRVIVDSNSYEPSVADTVLNTRLSACIRSSAGGPMRVTCGTEVCKRIYLYIGKYNRYDVWKVPTNMEILALDGSVGQMNALADLKYLNYTRAWTNFPRLNLRIAFVDEEGLIPYDPQSGASCESFYMISEIYNPTTLEWDTLNDMNRVCLYSVFGCFKPASDSGKPKSGKGGSK